MDVINLHKFGIKNVVANLGTAMTERQLDLIWRFFTSPVICLDGDESGKKAAIRAAERLFPLMKDDCKIGEDSLKLYFRIDKESNLYVKCQDKNREDLGEFNLGNIF